MDTLAKRHFEAAFGAFGDVIQKDFTGYSNLNLPRECGSLKTWGA